MDGVRRIDPSRVPFPLSRDPPYMTVRDSMRKGTRRPLDRRPRARSRAATDGDARERAAATAKGERLRARCRARSDASVRSRARSDA